MKYIWLALLLAGCSSLPEPLPMPKPAPTPTNFCKPNQHDNCRKMSASEISGGTVRGHGEDIEKNP